MEKDNGKKKFNDKGLIVTGVLVIAAIAVSVIALYSSYTRYNDFYGKNKDKKEDSSYAEDSASGTNYLDLLTDENIGKEVDAVGFMNGALSEDETAAWLMPEPFLDDEDIKSGAYTTVMLVAKDGKTLTYSEYAVSVHGVLAKDTDGNWAIKDCNIVTYGDGTKGTLEQFNQLVYMGYVKGVNNIMNKLYYIINENKKEEVDTTELSSIVSNLETNYADIEFMHQAAHIAEASIDLTNEAIKAQQNGDLEDNKEDFNKQAEELYNNFYQHLRQFKLTKSK